METIYSLRKMTGLSQDKFAKKYHISSSTLRNWEQGTRKPPEYVLYLLELVIKNDYQFGYKRVKSMNKRDDIFNNLVDLKGNALETYMRAFKDFYLDESVRNPAIVTINKKDQVRGIESGVKNFDMSDMSSMIILGAPRSGKSWFLNNMIAQIAAFSSPQATQFILCDPKGVISDFERIHLPHIKKKVYDKEEIAKKIRKLNKKTIEKRKEIIVKAGCMNVHDYNKRHKDKLPIIYFVVDEAVSILDEADEDTNYAMQNLLVNASAFGIIPIIVAYKLNLKHKFVFSEQVLNIITHRVIFARDTWTIAQATSLPAEEIEELFDVSSLKTGDMILQYNKSHLVYGHCYSLWNNLEGMDKVFDIIKEYWY